MDQDGETDVAVEETGPFQRRLNPRLPAPNNAAISWNTRSTRPLLGSHPEIHATAPPKDITFETRLKRSRSGLGTRWFVEALLEADRDQAAARSDRPRGQMPTMGP